jgi:hypothetical protein
MMRGIFFSHSSLPSVPHWAWVGLTTASIAIGLTVIAKARLAWQVEGLQASLYDHETVREASGASIVLFWALLNASAYDYLNAKKAAGASDSKVKQQRKTKSVDEDAAGKAEKKALDLPGNLSSLAATVVMLTIPTTALSLGGWWAWRVHLGLATNTCSQD